MSNIKSFKPMKIVINSKTKGAYSFENGELKELGKFHEIARLHDHEIYSIGNDIYQKENNKYRLLKENAELYLISAPEHNSLTNIDSVETIPNLNNAFKQLFCRQNNHVPFFVLKDLRQENYFVFVKDKHGKITEAPQKTVSVKKSFFWNGEIYTLQNNGFAKSPLEIIAQHNSYLVIRVRNTNPLFILRADGTVTSLGIYKNRHIYPNRVILLSKTSKDTHVLWNLSEDFCEKITDLTGDDTYNIFSSDQIIKSCTEYLYDENGPISAVPKRKMLTLNSDGHFVEQE